MLKMGKYSKLGNIVESINYQLPWWNANIFQRRYLNKNSFNTVNFQTILVHLLSIFMEKSWRGRKKAVCFHHWHKHYNYSAYSKKKMWNRIKYSMKWWSEEHDKWKTKIQNDSKNMLCTMNSRKKNDTRHAPSTVFFTFIPTKIEKI